MRLLKSLHPHDGRYYSLISEEMGETFMNENGGIVVEISQWITFTAVAQTSP